jgi:hypothetical protein
MKYWGCIAFRLKTGKAKYGRDIELFAVESLTFFLSEILLR